VRRGENDESRPEGRLSKAKSGGYLLSQGVYPQVPSAYAVLTSVFGMGTGVTPQLWPPETFEFHRVSTRTPERARALFNQALGRLVPVSYVRYRTSTSGLSTWWSSHGPYRVNPVGSFILEQASRLDAFSGYPFRR
jgi:hypothetical protein